MGRRNGIAVSNPHPKQSVTPKARPVDSLNNLVTKNASDGKALGDNAYKEHLFNTFQSMKFIRNVLEEVDTV
jgi:hypothetical protein